MQQIGSNNSAHIATYNDVKGNQTNHNYIVHNPDGSFLEQLKHPGGQTVLAPQFPPLTRTFVTREEPLEFINKILLGPRLPEDGNESRILVVTGLGGCGKTQIMLKFMKDHEAQFNRRFFVDGSSEDRIRADITQNVRSMGIEHSQKEFEECLLFLSQPSPNGVRLLLYDNVDDPRIDLSSLLPRGDSCAIAITSRNHLLGVQYPDAHLRLDTMSLDEAIELLLHGSNRVATTEKDRSDAASLAEALGCLPIALQQARSYMQQTQCSASAYLDRLASSRHKLLGKAIKFQMDMQSISTYAAFETSFGMLAPQIRKFLRLSSYFHWSNFPLELVALAARHQFSKYQETYIDHEDEFHSGKRMLEDVFLCDGEWDVTNFDEMTVALQNYSLVTIVPGVGTTLLQVHPLVHEWLQSCIPKEEQGSYQSAAIVLLAMGARYHYTASMQYLGSHVFHMSPLWEDLHVNNAAAFGLILHDNGFIQGGLELQERVVRDLRGKLDPDNMKLSNSTENLAFTYRSSGRLNEAATLQEEVLRLRKQIFGERNPDTITAANNLANTYRDLGRPQDAKVLQEEVLKLRKEILGERHPHTIAASSNLAGTYRDFGRLQDAKVLQEEVVKLMKETLGERHPDTITTSSNLANTYMDLGQLRDAKAIQEEVLKLRKEILGDRHPDTITVSNNLANTYSNLGRLQDAKVLQEEVAKLMKEILGERHPDTITASSCLASIYSDLGRLQDAKALEEEVVQLRKEILGERHHQTAISMVNLAITYISLGEKDAALELLNMAESILAEALGVAHPSYIWCQEMKLRAQSLGPSSHPTVTLQSDVVSGSASPSKVVVSKDKPPAKQRWHKGVLSSTYFSKFRKGSKE